MFDNKGFGVADPIIDGLPGAVRYARAEFMGHHTAYCRWFEVEFAGAKMLRIDEPRFFGGVVQFWTTELRNPTSLYSFRECTEDVVFGWHKRMDPMPPVTAIEHQAPKSYHEHNQGNGDPVDEDDGRCESCGVPLGMVHEPDCSLPQVEKAPEDFNALFAEVPPKPDPNQLDLDVLLAAKGDPEKVGQAIDKAIGKHEDIDDESIPF